MKRFFKGRKGQKGFTLIELLVVVAILGILAAVIVPNVGKFMGTGAVEAANTEAHNVQTAVIAYMADNSLATFGTTTVPETVGPISIAPGPVEFLLNPAGLQATYTIEDGAIVDAIPLVDGKWAGLNYDPATGWTKS